MANVGVITFPGSNCDADMLHAVSITEGLNAEAVWHKETSCTGLDAIILPGGFSYGDYLRAGAIARFSPVMKEVARFAAEGRPVLGVCNGFQILCEAGLLPGVLRQNHGQSFLCQDVHLVVQGKPSPWTKGMSGVLRIPIAHMEGAWYADAETLAQVEGEGQIVFRYSDEQGVVATEACPNGALNGVAGVCSARGNVVGLMPHPERVVEEVLGGVDGRGMFSGLAEWLQ